MFVTKLSPTGTLVHSTYLGGTATELSDGIAVDGSGNAYIVGHSWSTDFPVLNPLPDGSIPDDIFVTKLNAAGGLAYSTYLGGSQYDQATGIAVDGAGQAHITGYSYSPDFPLHNPFQSTLEGGPEDSFVTKLSASGSTYVYSTYIGGTDHDWAHDIGVTPDGVAFITGGTRSGDYPRKNAPLPFDSVEMGMFVTAFEPSGTTLRYSVVLGGMGFGIEADAAGNAYVTGETNGSDFPIKNAWQSVMGGFFDAVVVKLDPAGAVSYSTFLGGSGFDGGTDIAVDSAGQAYVTGSTQSTDFPLVQPIQATRAGAEDVFVAKFSASGALVFSTYLGGTGRDFYFPAIGVDNAENAVVARGTDSVDFPVVNAFQPTRRGPSDAFVTKIATASGSTAVSRGSAEPGEQVTVSASGLEPGTPYVLKLGTTAGNCRTGVQMGSSVVAGGNGQIGPTLRTIPTTITSGTRYLCWVESGDPTRAASSVPITIF